MIERRSAMLPPYNPPSTPPSALQRLQSQWSHRKQCRGCRAAVRAQRYPTGGRCCPAVVLPHTLVLLKLPRSQGYYRKHRAPCVNSLEPEGTGHCVGTEAGPGLGGASRCDITYPHASSPALRSRSSEPWFPAAAPSPTWTNASPALHSPLISYSYTNTQQDSATKAAPFPWSLASLIPTYARLFLESHMN